MPRCSMGRDPWLSPQLGGGWGRGRDFLLMLRHHRSQITASSGLIGLSSTQRDDGPNEVRNHHAPLNQGARNQPVYSKG